MLIDTSVWIRHLRKPDETLVALLRSGLVLVHPFVIGELSLGRLESRSEVLARLRCLDHAPEATDAEVGSLVESRGLGGSGIGWIDAHLAASALIGGVGLMTADRRLAAVAERLGLGPT